MNYTEQTIKKAIEGGYSTENVQIENGSLVWVYATPECGGDFGEADIFLDPSFWQCLGKSLGWGKEKPKEEWECSSCWSNYCQNPEEHPYGEIGEKKDKKYYFSTHEDDWLDYATRYFKDYAMQKKSPEEFFKNL